MALAGNRDAADERGRRRTLLPVPICAGSVSVRGADLSGTLPPPTASNVNWSTSGQTLANLALSTVGGEHALEVHCQVAGRTHVIVDIQGYVPFTA